MPKAEKTYDILILGLGPAGTVAAIHLQRMGYRVALLGELRRHAAFEGLAARTIEGFSRAGLEATKQVAGVEAERTASWNGLTNAANREFLVDRLALDRALLEDCRTAAIPVIRGHIGALENLTVRGNFLIEARGRRAPRRGDIAYRGPASLSLAIRFENVPATPPQSYLTNYQSGWCWTAQPGNGEAIVQITVSGNRPELAGKASLDALMSAELDKLPDVRARLGTNARPKGPVIARDSTSICSRHLADAASLRVGDAAYAIDPLSGHGNFEAVGGAMAAAAVVNTLLSRPESRNVALEFYDERAKSAFLRHTRVGRDFYRMESRWPDAPFWQARRDWPDNLPSHAPATATKPQVKSAPVIENGFIVARDVIVTADQPRGIRVIDNVPVADLLKALQDAGPDTTPEGLAQRFNAVPKQIETALNWLGHHGLLPGQESRRSAP